jgi:hypothetical protein
VRVDTRQLGGFAERVEEGRDVRAAQRSGAVVILSPDHGTAEGAFRGRMPPAGLCRVRPRGRRLRRESECVSPGQAA